MEEVKTQELPSVELVREWQTGVRGLFELVCQKRSWTGETGWYEYVRPAVEFKALERGKEWHLELLGEVLLGRVDATEQPYLNMARQMYLDHMGETPCIDVLRELLEAG